MSRASREAEKTERRNALRTYNAEDHIHEAEQLIEQAERQSMAPAAIANYTGAAAHAALATAKATLGRS